MRRKQLLAIVGLGLALFSCALAARLWSPALSAADACLHIMERTEGYGPWRAQVTTPVANAQPDDAIITYFDGFNTANCHARRYGAIWIVAGIGETMVSCGRGLSVGREQQCPRGTYGVIR